MRLSIINGPTPYFSRSKGKSFLINAVCGRLRQLAGFDIIARAAPTGVAANNINGVTLHSMLRLPVSKNITTIQRLSQTELSNLQGQLSRVRYIVIDEKSMISVRTLAFVDERLRQMFPSHQNEYFGGRSILLLGDFYQLPPIIGKPMYTSEQLSIASDLQGQAAYRAFDQTVVLQQVVRQQGDDQAPFEMPFVASVSGNQPLKIGNCSHSALQRSWLPKRWLPSMQCYVYIQLMPKSTNITPLIWRTCILHSLPLERKA